MRVSLYKKSLTIRTKTTAPIPPPGLFLLGGVARARAQNKNNAGWVWRCSSIIAQKTRPVNNHKAGRKEVVLNVIE